MLRLDFSSMCAIIEGREVIILHINQQRRNCAALAVALLLCGSSNPVVLARGPTDTIQRILPDVKAAASRVVEIGGEAIRKATPKVKSAGEKLYQKGVEKAPEVKAAAKEIYQKGVEKAPEVKEKAAKACEKLDRKVDEYREASEEEFWDWYNDPEGFGQWFGEE